MAGFDTHAYCACCKDKGKGTHLATPSYQKKKEKRDQKAIKEESSSTLVDPALVSVLGVAKDRQDLDSEEWNCTPVQKPRRQRVQKSRIAEMQKTRRQKQPKTWASLLRGHWLRLQSHQQTVNLRQWTRSGRNALAHWKLCSCPDLSTSQNLFSSQWSSLQLSLCQPVLLTMFSPSFNLTNRPPLTSNGPSN